MTYDDFVLESRRIFHNGLVPGAPITIQKVLDINDELASFAKENGFSHRPNFFVRANMDWYCLMLGDGSHPSFKL